MRAALGSVLAIAVGAGPVALAQQAGTGDEVPGAAPVEDGRDGIKEIVVTTRLKAENLQAVPLAIGAFSEDDLDIRGVESLSDLAQHTAGLEFATTGNVGGDRAIIRGLSQQTRVGDETNVATFVDGVYSPGFSGSTVLFDALERVEVVRGPQSASYGRNSFAGAINYISKKPGDVTDFGGRGTLGTDDHSALSTYVTGPLIAGSLAGRLDVAYRQSGGTFNNAIDGEPLSNKESMFGRAALRWTVGPLVIDGAVSYTDDDYSPTARTTISATDPRRVGKPAGAGNPFETGAVQFETGDPTQLRFGRRLQGEIRDQEAVFSIDPRAGGERAAVFSTLSVAWDLGDYELTSLTGYQTREVTSLSDVDRYPHGNTYASILLIEGQDQVIGQPFTIQSVTGSREDRDEFSQDFRLSFDADGAIAWSVGGYFSTEDFRDQRIRAGSPTLQWWSTTCPEEIYGTPSPSACIVTAATPQLSLNQDAILESEFYSAYAGLEFRFWDTWALSLEGRQTWENKSANNVAHNFPSNSLPEGDFGTQRFDYFTPRINLSDQVTDDLLLYALVAKGVKSGGFNANALCGGDADYDTEENWTYELGGKLALFENRATVNVAGFFIDWSDQQITGSGFEPANPNSRANIYAKACSGELSTEPVTRNVASTEVWGAELEMTAVPAEWLALNLNYTFIDGEYADAVFQTSQGWVDCPQIGTIDCVFDPVENTLVSSGRGNGNQLVNTSRHLVNVGAELKRALGGSDWDGFLRADFSWYDKRYVDSENIGWVPARENLNLRLGVRAAHWSVEGFCNNVTDDHTPLTSFPPRDFAGVPSIEVTNRTGRICGMTVGYRHL